MIRSTGKLSYDESEKLGDDGYEKVYIHTFKGYFEGKKLAAIKRRKLYENLKREVDFMLSVGDHPNILNYLGYDFPNDDYL